jgi:hypothetical protein
MPLPAAGAAAGAASAGAAEGAGAAGAGAGAGAAGAGAGAGGAGAGAEAGTGATGAGGGAGSGVGAGARAAASRGARAGARSLGKKLAKRWLFHTATNRKILKWVAISLLLPVVAPIMMIAAFLGIADHVLSALQVKPTIRVGLDAYRAAEDCPFASEATVGKAVGAAYLVASAWALTGDDVVPGGVYGGYQNPLGSDGDIPADIRALADPAELAPGGAVHDELELRGPYHLSDWTTVLGARKLLGSWQVFPWDPLGGEHGVGFLLIRPSDWRAWVKDVPINVSRPLDPWRPFDSFLVMACHLQKLEKEAGTGLDGVLQALVQYGDQSAVQLLDAVFDAPGRVLHDVTTILGRVLDMVTGLGSTFLNKVLLFMGRAQDVLGLGQSLPSAFANKDIPADYLRLIRQWAAPDLDWAVLAGVLKVECDFGRHCGVSSTGALGPAQFEPGTWAQYGVDGDGDGVRDPWNPADAVASEANYLRHLGLGRLGQVRSALCHYNAGSGPEFQQCMDGTQRPVSYADTVLGWATKYRGIVNVGGLVGAPTAAAAAAVAFALGKVGLPYVWGATGPSAFDCSGLVQTAYAAVGIHLPRTSSEQFNASPRVPPGAPIMPGDLVFFVGGDGPPYPGHVGMAISSTMMVDAPHTGAFVRVEQIWHDGYMGATRPTA